MRAERRRRWEASGERRREGDICEIALGVKGFEEVGYGELKPRW